MNRFYYRDLLETNPALLSSMMRFNSDKSTNASFEELDVALARILRKNHLLRAAYERRRVKSKNQEAFWDFKDESERLVLFPSDILSRLGKLLSACVFGEEISQCLAKAQVMEIREFLGEDIYRYALVRGRYQIGSFRNQCLEMFGGDTLCDRCKKFAWGSLDSLRTTWPDALKRKSAATFDAIDLPKASTTKTLSDETRRHMWELTKKILTREFDQQWIRYFV